MSQVLVLSEMPRYDVTDYPALPVISPGQNVVLIGSPWQSCKVEAAAALLVTLCVEKGAWQPIALAEWSSVSLTTALGQVDPFGLWEGLRLLLKQEKQEEVHSFILSSGNGQYFMPTHTFALKVEQSRIVSYPKLTPLINPLLLRGNEQ